MVVVTNLPGTEQAAILAAGKLAMQSICMVDLFALQEVKWIGQKGYADKVCVSRSCEAGRELEEIAVTGTPAFDHLAGPKK